MRPTVKPAHALAGLALAAVVIALPLLLAHRDRPPAPAPSSPALESLRSATYDPRYGLAYWTGKLDRRDHDSEWARALEFCASARPERYPNCRTIDLLHTASQIPGFPSEAPRP